MHPALSHARTDPSSAVSPKHTVDFMRCVMTGFPGVDWGLWVDLGGYGAQKSPGSPNPPRLRDVRSNVSIGRHTVRYEK
jgi:hypothetical protein